ncbi:hypothetical protein PCANC_09403 [Puccinia coronata f. sp. avenae]|uniref:Uncharacterized protein n=1 Tax=Puccinia coronata f. sp. avenae TaxID=200324 RepID=A0A2N5VDG6_9BASI|nr:hypothetical protein PCANC_09403 [Puccinia coronata f. sp. avenae]
MPSQPEQGDGSRHLLWDLEQETPNHNASTNPERVRVNLAVLSLCSKFPAASVHKRLSTTGSILYVRHITRATLIPTIPIFCTYRPQPHLLTTISASQIHTQEDPTSNP